MKFIQALQAFLLFAVLQQGAPAITAPLAGETLQGQVSIVGTVDAPNFASAELAFAYASDSTGTWFTLQSFSQPVTASALATWDTTLLTDGAYILRLRVFSQDGTFQDFTVTDLTIRNEAVPATATPSPTSLPNATVPAVTELPPPTAESASLPTAAPVTVSSNEPTPEPLPANPAAISVDQINFYLIRGALLAFALFVVLGLFLRLRRN